jgi:hypothetical protein
MQIYKRFTAADFGGALFFVERSATKKKNGSGTAAK